MIWNLKCRECDAVAFSLRSPPYPTKELLASDVIHKNGAKPGDLLTCQSCGFEIPDSWLDSENFIQEETEWDLYNQEEL